MKKYSIIIFDLDGTLTDPAEGIVNSVRYALNKFSIDENHDEKILKFIGPPLHTSFEKNNNLSPDEAKQAVAYYREYYTEKGMMQNRLYDGIPEILQTLKSKGCVLFVGTSKPTIYAKKILEYFNIAQYFTDIVGSNLDLTRVDKGEVIEHILKTYELTPKGDILMVGDTHFDIEGANVCGIDSIFVRYGYGVSDEVEKHNPSYTIANIKELNHFFESRT